jgi:5-methylthioadenosine/S-adenosylhomocysteine deaminase
MTVLVRGGWIAVGSGDQRRCLRDGGLLIQDGTIAKIGKYEALRSEYDAEWEIGGESNLVLPGLINSHYHGRGLTMLQRGLMDAPLELYVSHSRPTIEPYLDTLLACIRLIRSGTTSVLHNHIMYHNMQNASAYLQNLKDSLRAYLECGLRVAFAPAIADLNHAAYQEDRFLAALSVDRRDAILASMKDYDSSVVDTYFKTTSALLKEYNRYENRITILYSPRGGQWCSDELLLRIKAEAAKHSSPIHMHLLETKYQRNYALREFGRTMIEHMADLDFWGPEVSCAHVVWATKSDLEILARHGVSVVHNPSSNLRLFSGVAPVPEMLERGINVALGTDGLSINDDDDMFQEMRLCSLIHRSPGIHSRPIPSNTLVDMATVNGAKAIGMSPHLGALEVGNRADLIILDWPEFETPPGLSFGDAISYGSKQTRVRTVMVEGKVIMENGRLTQINEADVVGAVRKLRQDLAISSDDRSSRLKECLTEYYSGWDVS